MSEKYVAHVSSSGDEQPLVDHLRNTAHMASAFAESFGGEELAYQSGLYHDIGKYSSAGQKRMRHPDSTAKVDHSTAGAIETAKCSMIQPFVIAGHHGGLPDMGTKTDIDNGTLCARIKKHLEHELDYTACWQEIPYPSAISSPAWLSNSDKFSVQFLTRMIFSCLVDADFLDTEAFFSGHVDRGPVTSVS